MPQTQSKLIAVFGEVLWDILPYGAVLGGAPLNFALRACELGSRVNLISSVGDDDLGNEALEAIESFGLSVDSISRDTNHPTGLVTVVFESGQPWYEITTGVAFEHIAVSQQLAASVAQSDCVYFGTLIQRSQESAQTLHQLLANLPQSVVKFVDLNLRPGCFTTETIQWSVENADIVKLSDEEMDEVGQALGFPKSISAADFASTLVSKSNVTCCVVTMGGKGAVAAAKTNGEISQESTPGIDIKVVDTIGAGDSFSAGFVQTWLQGENLSRCLAVGNRLGALAATKQGGTSIFTSVELADALRA